MYPQTIFLVDTYFLRKSINLCTLLPIKEFFKFHQNKKNWKCLVPRTETIKLRKWWASFVSKYYTLLNFKWVFNIITDSRFAGSILIKLSGWYQSAKPKITWSTPNNLISNYRFLINSFWSRKSVLTNRYTETREQ